MNNNLKEQYKLFVNLMQENQTKALQTYFKLKPKMITRAEMADLINKRFPNMPLELLDNKYYVIEWSDWKTIIDFDWTNKKKYIAERYDCDNYASVFAAHMMEAFDLNSAGRLYCTQTGPNGVTNHMASLIIAINNGSKLETYAFEPQTDAYHQVRSANDSINMNGLIYQGYRADFN